MINVGNFFHVTLLITFEESDIIDKDYIKKYTDRRLKESGIWEYDVIGVKKIKYGDVFGQTKLGRTTQKNPKDL